MVDVSEKAATRRVARAEAFVEMSPATLKLLRGKRAAEG
jgi:molybdenum cofactor biosynthesis enzyme